MNYFSSLFGCTKCQSFSHDVREFLGMVQHFEKNGQLLHEDDWKILEDMKRRYTEVCHVR